MTTNTIIGAALIVAGLVIMAFGDKTVQAKGGVVQRLFSYPKPVVLVLKWVIGIGLAYVGGLVLTGGLEL